MKAFTSIYFLPAVHALVARDSTCCFWLSASGGPGGAVGQLDDGQNRIGQGLRAATYCINDGGLIDGNGRGCILTSPTTQWQCDSGASPTGGFSVGCNGGLEYNNNTTFSSCPTGDDAGYNIYETAPTGQQGCVEITLSADSCAAACLSSPQSCSTTLNSGSYEYPHLIVPVNSASPDTAYGTQYNGQVSSTVSSIFNFDIPSSDSGKTCSLVFLFPTQSQLQTSSYTFSGSGAIDFAQLASVATTGTTYANAPAVATDLGVFTVTPGTSTVISTFSCPAGQALSFELSTSDSTQLTYFQDYNPSPIGLYITTC